MSDIYPSHSNDIRMHLINVIFGFKFRDLDVLLFILYFIYFFFILYFCCFDTNRTFFRFGIVRIEEVYARPGKICEFLLGARGLNAMLSAKCCCHFDADISVTCLQLFC